MASKITVTKRLAKKGRGRPKKSYSECFEDEENTSIEKTKVILIYKFFYKISFEET